VACIRLGIASKIIVDTVAGRTRPGGGGVQAAAGARLTSDRDSLQIDLFAPVGLDFDDSLLTPLRCDFGVNTSRVTPLDAATSTPGEKISYDDETGQMRFEPVGWECWDELCAWEPPMAESAYDALHVIVEGGGAGEVRATLRACEAARRGSGGSGGGGGGGGGGGSLPCVGVEPILHEVDAAALAGLRTVTRIATVCSPDLAAAVCIARVARAERGARGAAAAGVALRPAHDVAPPSLAALRRSLDAEGPSAANDAASTALLDVAADAFDELAMQPGAILAIRDGAHGSYLYSRPAPHAPLAHWLADAGRRDFEWFAAVPAARLDAVADPTGAGNAYAGALTAQLAAGAEPVAAAATASAVGAAFCAADAWAPEDAAAAGRWVGAARAEVLSRTRVLVEEGEGARGAGRRAETRAAEF